MSNYSAILFDFGGTLADYTPQERLFERACRECGVVADPERLRAAENAGWDAYATPLGPAHPEASVDQDAFVRFKTALLQQRLQLAGVAGPAAVAARIYQLDTDPTMYCLYDDVLPTLDQLRAAGCRLAVLSNHEWELPDLIAGMGIGDYFDAVVTSARVGYRKPHPRMFQRALEQLDASPQQALMVGDNLAADVQGALSAGIDGVLLDRTGRQASPKEAPVIHRLTSLLEFL